MNDLLLTIASLCAIKGASAGPTAIQNLQSECQKKYTTCIMKADQTMKSPNELAYKLANCIKDQP